MSTLAFFFFFFSVHPYLEWILIPSSKWWGKCMKNRSSNQAYLKIPTLGMVTYSMHACLITQSFLLCDPMDCSLPGSSAMGFFRQGYWSRLSFTSPRDLPYSGIKPGSPALRADSSPSEPQESSYTILVYQVSFSRSFSLADSRLVSK